MTGPSLLAVFAHPDDESISAGGLLARSAADGARTACSSSRSRTSGGTGRSGS